MLETETRVMQDQAKEHQGCRPHQKPGERRGTHSPLKGTNPASTLISDFWLPELSEKTFLLF